MYYMEGMELVCVECNNALDVEKSLSNEKSFFYLYGDLLSVKNFYKHDSI